MAKATITIEDVEGRAGQNVQIKLDFGEDVLIDKTHGTPAQCAAMTMYQLFLDSKHISNFEAVGTYEVEG